MNSYINQTLTVYNTIILCPYTFTCIYDHLNIWKHGGLVFFSRTLLHAIHVYKQPGVSYPPFMLPSLQHVFKPWLEYRIHSLWRLFSVVFITLVYLNVIKALNNIILQSKRSSESPLYIWRTQIKGNYGPHYSVLETWLFLQLDVQKPACWVDIYLI